MAGVTPEPGWSERLKQAIPKDEIPAFLADLQALIAAMRDDQPWQDLLTPRLRAHAALALGYMQDGPKKEAVRRAL